jgi:hypothetical protein
VRPQSHLGGESFGAHVAGVVLLSRCCCRCAAAAVGMVLLCCWLWPGAAVLLSGQNWTKEKCVLRFILVENLWGHML